MPASSHLISQTIKQPNKIFFKLVSLSLCRNIIQKCLIKNKYNKMINCTLFKKFTLSNKMKYSNMKQYLYSTPNLRIANIIFM